MKQIIISFTLLILCLSNQLIGQIVSIPDSILKSKLLGLGIDTDFDNEISFKEAREVISLDLKAIDNPPPNYKYLDTIKSLKGLEAFIKLEFLDCSYNKIDTLDLMYNENLKIVKAGGNEPLTYVKLINNPLLEELDLLLSYNLSSIDLSSQVNLKKLDLSYTNIANPSLITNINLETLLFSQYISSTINISSLKNLKNLDITYSELTALDISNNNKLRSLITDWSPLQNILISGNDSLADISVNYGELTSLNLTGAPNVKNVKCVLNNLSTLNVAGLQELVNLNCDENELGVLDVSNNTNLFYISCDNNIIKQLIFENNDSLKRLHCSNNNLTYFELSNTPNIIHIECRNNLFTNLTVEHSTLKDFFICQNSQLKCLDITNAQGIRNLQLNNMSQPIKVCVWELPFPPFDSTYIIVGKIESPNVTFENCLDETYEVSEQFIKIYPNPTSSVLQIELQNVIENEIDLDLYNSNGVSVIKKKYDRNFNRINLVIEDFPQGVYFLKIFINGNGYFRKILIK